MLKIIILCVLLVSNGYALAKDIQIDEPLVLAMPILSPNEAVKLAENYIIKMKNLDRNKIRLSGVSFEYFSRVKAPPGVIAVGWTIHFECIPSQLHCSFSVGISNTKKAEIVMYPVP